MKKLKIYIASCYTLPKGKELENTLNSFRVFNKLSKLGFIPFAPLTSHYIHEQFPQEYDFWIDYDIEWLKCCDAVLRLPGKSKGADYEVKKAHEFGIDIFYNIMDLLKWQRTKI